MARVLIDESNLINIADAIREKSNTTNTYSVIDMPEAINNIVSHEISLQEKTINPSINTQVITPNSGYDGLSKVIVNAVNSDIDSNIKSNNIKKDINILGVTGTLEEGIIPNGTLDITTNGIYDITEYANVNVNTSESKNVCLALFVEQNTNSYPTTAATLRTFLDLEGDINHLISYPYGDITIYGLTPGETEDEYQEIIINCKVYITSLEDEMLIFLGKNDLEETVCGGYIFTNEINSEVIYETHKDFILINFMLMEKITTNNTLYYIRWDV